MKRLFTFLATFSLIETIGRHPVMAGVLMLLGVGGGAGIANLITPSIIPQRAAYFNQNQNIGTTSNGLTPNGGTPGAMYLPTDVTRSFTVYMELGVDAQLPYAAAVESPFAGGLLTGNGAPGQPTFGLAKAQWYNAPSPPFLYSANASGGVGGTLYNTGYYPFTFTGGGPCQRYPSGVWYPNQVVEITDPGFMCSNAATASPATIPNAGAQQTGVTATCAASSVSGQMLVTTVLSVSPGLTPGQTYALSGFTTSGGTSINTTFTATSISGSGPYTLVGTATGTCPTISSTGSALSGTGSSTINSPTISTTAPFNSGAGGQSGITMKNGQHICMAITEYGDEFELPRRRGGRGGRHRWQRASWRAGACAVAQSGNSEFPGLYDDWSAARTHRDRAQHLFGDVIVGKL